MNGTDHGVTEASTTGSHRASQEGTTQEVDRELSELRREVLEARNQAIRTDNQVTNLVLDIKSVDRRIEQFARKARFAGFGATIAVAIVVAGAAFLAHSVRIGALEGQVKQYQAQAASARSEADSRVKQAEDRLADLEQRAQRQTTAEKLIGELLDDLDKGRMTHASELIAQVKVEDASPLTQRLVKPQIDQFRAQAAEKAYRSARSLLSGGKTDDAYAELRRGLHIEPNGDYAQQSRYLLASTLWSNKRYDEAVTVAREMLKENLDHTLATEVRFIMGTSLARLNRLDDAAAMLREVVKAGGSYSSAAKAYLSAIESGQELPPVR